MYFIYNWSSYFIYYCKRKTWSIIWESKIIFYPKNVILFMCVCVFLNGMTKSYRRKQTTKVSISVKRVWRESCPKLGCLISNWLHVTCNGSWVQKRFFCDKNIENVASNINLNKVTHCIINHEYLPKYHAINYAEVSKSSLFCIRETSTVIICFFLRKVKKVS